MTAYKVRQQRVKNVHSSRRRLLFLIGYSSQIDPNWSSH